MKQFKISAKYCDKNADRIYFHDDPNDAWERKYGKLIQSKEAIYDFIYEAELQDIKYEYFFLFLAN